MLGSRGPQEQDTGLALRGCAVRVPPLRPGVGSNAQHLELGPTASFDLSYLLLQPRYREPSDILCESQRFWQFLERLAESGLPNP